MPAIWFLLLFVPTFCSAVTVIDSQNRTLQFEKPAQRIISLAPHITELVFAAGAGNKLMGVSALSDYPPEAALLPVVSSHSSVNFEKIIQFKPDLVIVWSSGISQKYIDKLTQLGLVIYHSEPTSIERMFKEIEDIGLLAGTSGTANQTIKDLQIQQRKIIEKYNNKTKVTVFYQVWDRPLMTINQDHIIHQVINDCGGKNLFAEMNSLTPTVDPEKLLKLNPEVFLRSSPDIEQYKKSQEWYFQWQKWQVLSAVKNQNYYELPDDYISRATPRILNGLEQICEILDQVRKQKK